MPGAPRPTVLTSNSMVAEREIFERRVAAVQSHQTVIKAQLPEELRVFLRLPAVGRHGDRNRRGAPRNREPRQEAYAEDDPAEGLAKKNLHESSVWTRWIAIEQNVARRTGV